MKMLDEVLIKHLLKKDNLKEVQDESKFNSTK